MAPPTRKPAINNYTCRFVLLSLVSSLLLTGCGGGADDLIKKLGEATTCSVKDCKDSSNLSLEEIRANYLITQTDSTVKVEASFSQSANLATIVSLSGSDRVSANIGSQSNALSDIGGHGTTYATNLSDASPQANVNVIFYRGTNAYVSSVTMPKQFTMVSPSGEITLGRSDGKLYVQLDVPLIAAISASTKMHCQRVDNSAFDATVALSSVYDSKAPDGPAYRIDTLALEQSLNEAGKAIGAPNSNLSLVQSCDLELIWTLSQSGQASIAMYKNSSITAQRSVSHLVQYDTRK